MRKKCLIIRFSSFGDIVQAMATIPPLIEEDFEVHWLTKKEFGPLLRLSNDIHKVWEFDKKLGLFGLIKFALTLRSQNFTHIYDAHKNVRSSIVCLILRFFNKVFYTYRSKERLKRILLFKFRVNKFPKPYKGMNSYLFPLKEWGIGKDFELTQTWNFDFAISSERRDELRSFTQKVAIAPSAAWEMKRWPLNHWRDLLINWKTDFIILGGPNDHFCKDLEEIDPNRIKNMAGKLSLIESAYIVAHSKLLISADTGLIHVADLLGKKGISLMGPTAFGFATNKNITTLEVPLDCRPCTKDGRGKCTQEVYQKCMVDILPTDVIERSQEIIQ